MHPLKPKWTNQTSGNFQNRQNEVPFNFPRCVVGLANLEEAPAPTRRAKQSDLGLPVLGVEQPRHVHDRQLEALAVADDDDATAADGADVPVRDLQVGIRERHGRGLRDDVPVAVVVDAFHWSVQVTNGTWLVTGLAPS